MGLAPEWEEGPCDTDCQEWVSACVLARTNVSGQEVALHLRGDHPALSGAPHPDYPHYEASFFGNLFTGPDHEYLCPGTLTGPVFAQLEGRTCSNVVGGYCDFTVYPLCLDTDPLWLLDRCDYAELVPPVASQCRTGLLPGGSPLRAISTYVGDVL